MARSRSDDDYEDDDLEDRPKLKRRDPEADDYDDDRRTAQLGPLDKMYRDTSTVVLVIFGCCCGMIAFILSLVAYFTAKDEKAKSNALMVVIISAIVSALGIVANIATAIRG